MRRVLPVALLASALAMVPSAGAQHGSGGHMGGGHAGGMGMGHPGNFGGPHFSAPAGRAFGGYSGGAYSGFSGRPYSSVPRMVSPAPANMFSPGYRIPTLTNGGSSRELGRGDFHDRGRGDRDHDRYRSRYGGFGGYGYGYSGYVNPGYVNSWEVVPWDLGDFSGYEDSSSAEQAPADNEQQPSQAYSPDQGYAGPPDTGYRPGYGGVLAEPAPPVAAAPVAPEPELTLIFRDGRKQPIHNYVLTPTTIVVLDQAASGRQQRIPLDEINVPATEQAARDAGLDFRPPV